MDHWGQIQEQTWMSNKQDQNTNTKYTSDSAPNTPKQPNKVL